MSYSFFIPTCSNPGRSQGISHEHHPVTYIVTVYVNCLCYLLSE